ncbi:hypothetical protein CPC08DRAFT_781321 [Agrocybe pediades]|nr:hypothetical protein CPC08DRAFT_781321 [Agrocybe pediades]
MCPRLKQLFNDASQEQLKDFLLNHLHMPRHIVDDPYFARENSNKWAFIFDRYVDYIRSIIGRSGGSSSSPSASPSTTSVDSSPSSAYNPQEEPDPNPTTPSERVLPVTPVPHRGSGSAVRKRKQATEAEGMDPPSYTSSLRKTRSMSAAEANRGSSAAPAAQSASASGTKKTRARRPNDSLHWAKGGPASVRAKTPAQPAAQPLSSTFQDCAQFSVVHNPHQAPGCLTDLTSPLYPGPTTSHSCLTSHWNSPLDLRLQSPISIMSSTCKCNQPVEAHSETTKWIPMTPSGEVLEHMWSRVGDMYNQASPEVQNDRNRWNKMAEKMFEDWYLAEMKQKAEFAAERCSPEREPL